MSEEKQILEKQMFQVLVILWHQEPSLLWNAYGAGILRASWQ